ncbi:MAG: ATP-dependent zinc metalloprotease FtsH [Alphaproteobacteria bacterium]|nr:ATP-dependent zinc metalloprotease FtsH [Alphaproteobacteria bacterium]
MGALLFNVLQGDIATKHTWTEVKSHVEEGRVERVVFHEDKATVYYKAGQMPDADRPMASRSIDVGVVPMDKDFTSFLEAHDVAYAATPRGDCDRASGWLLPMIMLGVLFFFLFRREGGAPPGVATFGKSRATLAPEEGTGVTFADVAGIDEAIEELQEIVQFLSTPERFTVLGGKIPKGVLLVGPPGTGKTLLARAVAGEAGVPFFSISGSDFVEMFVGVGAARVRDLFKEATERAPCIIFIDELDAIGKARGGASPVGGHDEREQTLNQLLVEMDGFDGRKGIIIMAATNRPEILDPALLRAGRFDRQVLVDRPDVRGREAILRVHAREMKLADEVDLSELARITPGFAGADLANALNEGALLAARRGKSAIQFEDLQDAVERIVAGLEKKSRRLSEQEKRVVAFHEAGHAICAAACPGADPVQKISIIPRGIGALGYTLQMPLEDRYLMARSELLNRLTVLYGGRAAEELVFGDFTTGAGDDIRKASDLARRMVSQFGMSSAMGAVDYGGEMQNPFGIGGGGMRDVPISEQTAQQLDTEVRRILDEAHARSRAILTANEALLHRMSEELLGTEVLERDRLQEYFEQVEVHPLTGPRLREVLAMASTGTDDEPLTDEATDAEG